MANAPVAALLRCGGYRGERPWTGDGVLSRQETRHTSSRVVGKRSYRAGQLGAQQPSHSLQLFLSCQLELLRPLIDVIRRARARAELQRDVALGRADQPCPLLPQLFSLKPLESSRTLTIACSHDLAQYWLMPRFREPPQRLTIIHQLRPNQTSLASRASIGRQALPEPCCPNPD
jgi:hypothetical protein